MTAIEVKRDALRLLREARDVIESGDSWCQHHYAEDADGASVDVLSDIACRWCGTGVLFLVARREVIEPETEPAHLKLAEDRLNAAAQQLYGRAAPYINDIFGLNAIVRVYAHAVELLDREIGDIILERAA